MEFFNKALGVHPFSLQLRLDRAEIISGNLANVDTPIQNVGVGVVLGLLLAGRRR